VILESTNGGLTKNSALRDRAQAVGRLKPTLPSFVFRD
jgi:hypothetical protein